MIDEKRLKEAERYHCSLPSLVSKRTCLDVEHMVGVVLCPQCLCQTMAAEVRRLRAVEEAAKRLETTLRQFARRCYEGVNTWMCSWCQGEADDGMEDGLSIKHEDGCPIGAALTNYHAAIKAKP